MTRRPVWRVGNKLGRTLYRDEVLVGLVDTPELAAEIVASMNHVELTREMLTGEWKDVRQSVTENDPPDDSPLRK